MGNNASAPSSQAESAALRDKIQAVDAERKRVQTQLNHAETERKKLLEQRQWALAAAGGASVAALLAAAGAGVFGAKRLAQAAVERTKLRSQLQQLKHVTDGERHRLEKELDHAKKYAHKAFATDLLAVADSTLLCRSAALPVKATIPKMASPDDRDYLLQYMQGVELTGGSLFQALKKHGVEKMELGMGDGDGQERASFEFDPNLHEAVSQDAEVEKNRIATVHREGFYLHGRVLRPARVVVGSRAAKSKDGRDATESSSTAKNPSAPEVMKLKSSDDGHEVDRASSDREDSCSGPDESNMSKLTRKAGDSIGATCVAAA